MQDTAHDLHKLLESITSILDETVVAQRASVVWHRLLASKDPEAPAIDMLHAKHGHAAARVVWKAISSGMRLTGTHAFTSQDSARYSMVAYCIMRGTVPILDAVVLAGPPPVVPTRARPTDLTGWLDLLSSTEADRAAMKVEKMMTPTMVPSGAVGTIASFADVFPGASRVAMEVVWRTSPHHPGFNALATDPTELGSLVREFVMQKHIGHACCANPVAEAVAPGLRRRRFEL